MPVKRASSLYNDPSIGAIFENLSGMFAPPKATDILAYTKARAERAEAERIADLYQNGTGMEKDVFDRKAVAAGRGSIANGYYGVDTTAATSRLNNSADNERALAQTRMQQSGETTRTMLAPVAQGATRFVPPSIASLYQVDPTQSGNIELKPGEQTITPDGRTLAGPAKPLSMTEWEASEAAAAAKRGEINPVDVIMGRQSPVQAVGPEGKPVYMAPGVAARTGAEPFINKGASAKPETQNYKAPDGRSGTAVYDPVFGKWKDTQTGQDLPAGSTTFNAQLQGDRAGLGLPTTANNTSANNQAAEITRSLNTVDIYENLIRNNPGSIGMVGLIRGTAQNAIATAQDLSKSFGKSAPEIEGAASALREGLKSVAPQLFDPSIPEAEFLQGAIAYGLARTENPSGEVSRQAYERAHDRVKGGGILANSSSALAATSAYRKILQTQLDGLGVLRDPKTARTDVTARDPAGGSAPAAAPAGPATRLRFDANGNPIQ